MAPKNPRRGSTNTSTTEAAFMTDNGRNNVSANNCAPAGGAPATGGQSGPRNLTKHRLVQTGIWTPAGASTRIMYAAGSDAGCSLDGQRKTNQDSFLINVPDPKGKVALFGVFDGHGENGHLVSRCCRARYGDILKGAMAKRANDLDASTTAAYIEVDQECNQQTDCSQSGTTAVTCMFAVDKDGKTVNLQTAWAGDSRAVLGSAQAKGAMASTDLSDDQKPDRPDEMARIQRAGGIVEPVFDENGEAAGPARVWYLAQVAPGLAMARSIGDAVGAMVGVIAEPEITNRALKPEDALCIIASDGLWEFLSSEQVIAMATKKLREKPPVTEQTILDCACFLADEARKEWLKEDLYVDDITVLVCIIQQMAPASAAAAKGSGGSAKAAGGAPGGGGGGQGGKRGAVSSETTKHKHEESKDVPLKTVKKSAEASAIIMESVRDPTHLIFQGMSDAARQMVCDCMFAQATSVGEAIIKQGEYGDVVYIVESGTYDVYLEQAGDAPITTYKTGDSFGELALMYSSARAATVKCTSPGVIWGLDRVSYKRLVKGAHEDHADAMTELIKQVGELKDLDAHQLNALVHSVQIEQLTKGQVLLKNAKPDSLYIVETGAIELVTHGAKDGAKPTKLVTGGSFGEGALAGDGSTQPSVTATASEPTNLIRITHEAFVRHVGALMEIKREQFNVHALTSIPDLHALNLAEKRHIAKVMTQQKYAAGTVIAKAGGAIPTLHIVHKGTVSKGDPKAKDGPTLGEGEYFGEAALVGHAQADVQLVAKTEVLVMVATRDAVQKQLGPLSAIFERDKAANERKHKVAALKLSDLAPIKILGIGTFGVVRLVQDKASSTVYALKQMRKDKILEMGQEAHLLAECRLLAECDHPFIVNLVKLFEDKTRIYLLQEPQMGGELFSVLRAEKYFPERRCVFYSAMIVLIFEYLHSKHIVYRDLKPENMLFDKDGYLKMVDFGFAKRVEDRTWTVCGTPEYMAPEIILNKGHNKAVDWWTTGIIIFEMLVGFPPFEGADPLDLYKAIVANDIKYPKKIGLQAQECISGLLRSSPADRLGSGKHGVDDIKKAAFFKKIVAWQSLLTKKIEAPYKPQLKGDLDVSQFDDFDDPDEGDPPKDVKKGQFDEFKKLAESFNK